MPHDTGEVYSLGSQAQRPKQSSQATHGQPRLNELHPLDDHLPQQVGWHAQQRVHQVVNLAIAQHHVHQLWVINKVDGQASIW